MLIFKSRVIPFLAIALLFIYSRAAAQTNPENNQAVEQKKIATEAAFSSSVDFSQSDKVVVSGLTEIVIKKYYTPSEIEELQKNPTKLKVIDYLYSKSFEVLEPQQYSQEQLMKFDINKYDTVRKLDTNVSVFDEASGLSFVLYSLNKVEADKKLLIASKSSEKDPSSKITDQ